MTERCNARPETVYDILADLRSHLDWAGARQSPDYRLLTIDAPGEPAIVGTVFTSTGSLPGSRLRWNDRSEVRVADRPSAFEFITEGEVAARRTMRALWLNRYEIVPLEAGCVVHHKLALLEVANPLARLGIPVLRWIAFQVAIPKLSGQGLRNLVECAEAQQGRMTIASAAETNETRAARPIPYA